MAKTLRALLALALAALICALSNVAACFVDTPTMRENAAQGARMLIEQGSQPELVGGFASARLDNYTAVLILKTAAYTGPEPLAARAFGGLRAEVPAQEGQDAWAAFGEIADGAELPTGGLAYPRYWHGYTLPLRLLLCAFNVSNIQALLLFAQGALLLCVALLMARRGLSPLLPGFAAAYFLMAPSALGVCLQYAPAALVTLGACAVLLRWDAQIERSVGLPGFFALVGLLVNDVDLLTFPLVTLGFPLVLSVGLDMLRREGSALGALRRAVGLSAAWAAGYFGMWAFKWLLTAAFIGPEWVVGVLEQARLRVSTVSNDVSFSRLDVVRMNLAVLTDKAAYWAIAALAAAVTLRGPALAAARARREGRCVRMNARALALLIPLALPFLWLLAFSNHAYDHTYFTYRILTCAVFAGYALLAFAQKPNAS